MKFKHLIYGIATFFPGFHKPLAKGTGGTDSARYCYTVWMRHLVMARKNGLNTWPKIVAELGPGDSIGTGLAALISGCDHYYAFDVVEYANTERNITIFDELVHLFKNKSPIPGDEEFPKVKPKLDDYSFPSDIFDHNRLQKALEISRIDNIRKSIKNNRFEASVIQYKVPWNQVSELHTESVDMIFSQAVLEHVDDLENAYRAMFSWLKPSGHISHAIDFKSHGTADEWNGHWTYPDFIWALIRGKRPYLLNRAPFSYHVKQINDAGFMLKSHKKTLSTSNLTLDQLAAKFRSMTDEDLVTSGVFIQAVKK